MFLCTYRLSRNSFSIIYGILLFWKEINSKNALVCSKILVYCLPVCDGGGGMKKKKNLQVLKINPNVRWKVFYTTLSVSKWRWFEMCPTLDQSMADLEWLITCLLSSVYVSPSVCLSVGQGEPLGDVGNHWSAVLVMNDRLMCVLLPCHTATASWFKCRSYVRCYCLVDLPMTFTEQ